MAKEPRRPGDRFLRIWLVEDSPVDVEITRWAARRVLPCEVVVLPDGESAVAALRDEEPWKLDRPDLVLLDLHLPGMSGLDVLRHLRSQPAHRLIPVIVLTSSGDDDVIVECYASGANSFLPKPATDAGFAEALRLIALGAAGTPVGNAR